MFSILFDYNFTSIIDVDTALRGFLVKPTAIERVPCARPIRVIRSIRGRDNARCIVVAEAQHEGAGIVRLVARLDADELEVRPLCADGGSGDGIVERVALAEEEDAAVGCVVGRRGVCPWDY